MAAFSDIPEAASSICDTLAILGGQDRTGVINLVSTDPQVFGVLKREWKNNYEFRVRSFFEHLAFN
jgi:hypothetical protein